MGRRNAINELGQDCQVPNEIDEQLTVCEQRINYGYLIDRVIFLDIKFANNIVSSIVTYNLYKYIIRIPGTVEFKGFVGPSVTIHKNNVVQTSVPFPIKYNDELKFSLENNFNTFQ